MVPSTQDEEKTKNDLVDLKSYFKDSEDYDLVVRRNSDNPNNIFSFISSQDISDINFKNLANQDKGSVVGPFLFSEQVYRLAKLATKKTDSIIIIPIGIAYSSVTPKFRSQFCLSFGKPILMNDNLKLTIKEFNNILYKKMINEEKTALKNVGR